MSNLLCLVCSKFFPEAELSGHVASVHFGFLPFACTSCDFTAAQEAEVLQHAENEGHIPFVVDRSNTKPYLTSLSKLIVGHCKVFSASKNFAGILTGLDSQIAANERNTGVADAEVRVDTTVPGSPVDTVEQIPRHDAHSGVPVNQSHSSQLDSAEQKQLSFIALLKEGGIARPDGDALATIVLRYGIQADLAINSRRASLAVGLYRSVLHLPSTTTMGYICDQFHVSVNGPLSLDHQNILHAMDIKEMKNVVIKFFPEDVRMGQSLPELQAAIESELSACEALSGLNVPGLVKCKVVPFNRTAGQLGRGSCKAIIMPHYVSSLQERPQFPENLIAAGFRRILFALRQMHALELVHMDVKSQNVFVDDHLHWDLGDFGATVEIGKRLLGRTEVFNPYYLPLTVTAIEAMDMVQLCVMVAFELVDKKTWRQRLLAHEDDRDVAQHLVRACLSDIKDETFRDEAVQLFDANFKLASEQIGKLL